MARVYLSVGSNIDREYHIKCGVDALRQCCRIVAISKVYESEAVGFHGENFYNFVLEVETHLPVGELSEKLKEIENKFGRDRSAEKFSARTLDIDILTYDDHVGCIDNVKLPRDEITKHAFVLLPLCDIAPHVYHPLLQRSYLEIWRNFDSSRQRLWAIPFEWASHNHSQ